MFTYWQWLVTHGSSKWNHKNNNCYCLVKSKALTNFFRSKYFLWCCSINLHATENMLYSRNTGNWNRSSNQFHLPINRKRKTSSDGWIFFSLTNLFSFHSLDAFGNYRVKSVFFSLPRYLHVSTAGGGAVFQKIRASRSFVLV